MRSGLGLRVLCWLAVLGAGCGRDPLKVFRAFGDAGGGPATIIDASGAGAGANARGDAPVAVEGPDVNLEAGRPDAGSDAADGAVRPDAAPSDAGGMAMLVGVDLTPAFATIGVGTTIDFVATGRYADGTKRDLSAMAIWTAAPAGIVMMMGASARAVMPGEVAVTVLVMGQRASARLVVTPAMAFATLSIEPVDPVVAVTFKLPLRAFALFMDGTKVDVTTIATWTSSDPAVATVGNGATGAGGVATGVKTGTASISVDWAGVMGKARLTVAPATLTAIEVTPTNPMVPVKTSTRFTATGVFSDGSTADITAAATWSSDAPAVFAVSSGSSVPGNGTALAAGSALVSARLGAVSGSTVVNVYAAILSAIVVKPDMVTVPRGGTQGLNATGMYADGSIVDLTRTVAWSSAGDAIASVSNAPGSEGLATGLSAGMTRVLATFGGVTGMAAITVTTATVTGLAITPAIAVLAVGTTLVLAATATYSDGSTRDVTEAAGWMTADPLIAAVANGSGTAGTVKGLSAGTTKVSALYAGQSASASITVANVALVGVMLEPNSAMVPAGKTQNFRATALYADGSTVDVTLLATYSVDDTKVATVSNAAATKGLLTAVNPGGTTIRGRFDGKEGTARLTVFEDDITGIRITPVNPNLHPGETVNFVATAIYANGATRPLPANVTWTSANAAVATIAANSTARCVSVGTSTITASYQGRTDSTLLSCADPLLIDVQVTPFTATILVGAVHVFQALAVFQDFSTRDITAMADWSTSNPAVAIVTSTANRGRATGIAAGTVKISATWKGMSAFSLLTVSDARLVALSVSPVLATTRVGQGAQFVATGLYSDGIPRGLTGVATWSSSNSNVADVSNAGGRGRATGFAPGTTTITATAMGFTDTATLTVAAGRITELQVTPVLATLVVAQRQQYQAIAIYDDGSNQNVTGVTTWLSANSVVADVSNGAARGQATGLGAGTTSITGTYMGVSASGMVTVTSAKLTEIQVTPVNASIPKGARQQFQAVGIYSDNTSRNLTGQVTWQSSNRAVAAISTANGSSGQLTALGPGTVMVTATTGGMMGQARLTVTDALLTEISVTPVNTTLPRGIQQQYHAVGIYSDGGSRLLTGLVTWNSDSEAVAAVSNAVGSKGVATAVSPGLVKITATLDAITGTTNLTVGDAALMQIQVTPANSVLPKGLNQQFQSVGIYSDGSHRTLTGVATWNSTNEAIAAVSNVGGRGAVTAVGPGSARISASLGGITGDTPITVSDATLSEIQLTPGNSSVPRGVVVPFTAIGIFSDLSTRNLTGVVTWISSDPAVAAISDAPGSRGRATPLSAGTTKISAAYLGKTGTTTLKVTAATISQIQIIPARVSVPVGVRLALTATAVMSDNTTLTVTDAVTWTSGDATVASVSNAPGSWGLTTMLKAGTTTVTATLLGSSGTATVAVGAQQLQTITVRPSDGTVVVGGQINFTATGTYDDGSSYDITQLVTWLAGMRTVAALSNVDGSRGQATGVSSGISTVDATYQGKTGTAKLTVAP